MVEKNESDALADLIARYGKEVRPSLEKAGRLEVLKDSGVLLDALCTPLQFAEADYLGKLGLPGQMPYTRGIQQTMYRGRPWTIRQYAGFGSATESNARYRFLLDQGQKGLSVAFDLPTQMGLDADHPSSEGEVGKVGVSIGSMEDMEILFDRLHPPGHVPGRGRSARRGAGEAHRDGPK
jgi:methylmalonyl-CoA mutase N-terminal domain/subunit